MDNAVPVTEPSSIAQSFASQFSSTYSSTTSLDPDILTQEVETRVTTPAASISNISFSHDDLHEAVRFIKPSQNPGPNYAAPSFLKLIYPHVTSSLLLMFQSFVDNAFAPQKWKESFVTPVHKGRGKPTCEVSSYRPVLITSILCRTFKRLVNRSIIDFREQNSILASSPHGFRPNRSSAKYFHGMRHDSNALNGRRSNTAVARIRLLSRCLDGSLDDSYISSVVRYSKRTGQPEPMYARKVRHQNSLIPAAVRDFLSAP
ncbi:hypothetical protein HPB49_013517 [Dermacentor silvarum]|uniref:Uncharacterized protein n=1 Tax=Dermacentor silvarum TaxID=543639 RepID=A0ACB8DP97_DERSI|nr:hypothetical protein HPB49_013517 [Dermacentor silvarum]